MTKKQFRNGNNFTYNGRELKFDLDNYSIADRFGYWVCNVKLITDDAFYVEINENIGLIYREILLSDCKNKR